jgi:hypothetical protein
MWNQPNIGSTEILNVANHRRVDDLAESLGRKNTEPSKSFIQAEFASYAYLAIALAGVGLLCSGLFALAFIGFRT